MTTQEPRFTPAFPEDNRENQAPVYRPRGPSNHARIAPGRWIQVSA